MKDALAQGTPAGRGPAIGPEVLEGFQPSDAPGEELAGPNAPTRPPRRTERPPSHVVATYRDSGTRLPSPWALAGFVPVAVLLASGGYSAWWRRRQGAPA
ncbi:MAG: hypothetical protein M3357_10600 [Actinomycetota bacterium]|nr:hypothetical protein [Actinomycetota bacterium]